jgi:hypothetical protein
MSCATHRLEGGVALEGKIYGPDGELIDTLRNF